MANAPTVRAKFQCLEIKHHHVHNSSGVMAEIRLVPVYGTGEENSSWSKATPSGEIKMTITNEAAVEKYELGKFYFVDFTPAD